MNKYSKFVKTDELKKARIKKKKNYENMANEIGLKSPISYYNLEVGIVEPKISHMIKVSNILGKPVNKFFNLQLQEN